MHTPTVAIIGAGPSGLTAAKEAKACGLEPTIFEKSSGIGGLWKPGSGTWEGMQTNISHHTCRFSDFPWKEGIQDFPTQQEVHAYLVSYADHFKIHPHVRLNTEVQKIQQNNSRWTVEWLNKEDSAVSTFDHVIVCSGIFTRAFTPEICGLNTFKGDVIHAQNYTKPAAFKGKIVAVIGNAFSGSELACAIAGEAEKVINIFKHPIWIMPRRTPKMGSEEKIPFDLRFYSRAAAARVENMDASEINQGKNKWFHGVCSKQGQISSELKVEIPPEHPPFVAISDSYLEKVELGKILPKKGSIAKIGPDTLTLEDGAYFKVDAIVFCTGYRTEIPFLEPNDQKLLGYQADDPFQPFLMHKTAFHPEFPNMAFVGMYRGPFFGGIELLARMVCMTFSKKIASPSKEAMIEGIKHQQEIRNLTPRPQFPHGNYVQFCHEIAELIGVAPDLEKTKKENPLLYEKLFHGPFTTASFRLEGFGSDPQAALQIIDQINQAVL